MTSSPQRPLPSSAFGADDGSADARITAALAAFDRGEGGSADVLAALAVGRLLIPVVAVPTGNDGDDGESEHDGTRDGRRGEHDSDRQGEHGTRMATVLTTGKDGRRGLLAFTGVEALRRWDPNARPSPVSTRAAAEAALADGADALVIDLAGPVVFSIDAPELRSLASGWRPIGPWNGVGAADPGSAAQQSAPVAPTARDGVRMVPRRVWQRVRRSVRRAVVR